MRPHKLMMKAFGPFARETYVDFDRMGNNIYLISGNTGSGKTTIFDGIIYALYGTASGGARSNIGTEAFHSDYVKDGKHREEMRVELDFSNAGRKFRVERRMFWGKRGNAKKAEKESVLYEDGNMVASDHGKESSGDVTKKIREILGLDEDQFRQIIMLAQGEFQKFLKSKSDERGTILGKLYDNRKHQDFQIRLKAAGVMLDDRDKSLVTNANAQLGFFVCPDYVEEEDKTALVADHPALLETIDKIIGQMDVELSEIEAAIKAEEDKKSKLEEKRTKGEESNKLLDDLRKEKEALARLDEEKEEYTDLKGRVKLAEAAEKVLPSEKAMIQVNKEWDDLLKTIKKLESEKETLEKKQVAMQEHLEELEAVNTPQIERLGEEKARLQNILHFYKDLSDSIRLYKEKEKARKEAVLQVGQAEDSLKKRRERQEELSVILKELEGAGQDRIINAENQKGRLADRESGLEEIRKAVKKVKKLEKEEKELAIIWQNALLAEGEAVKEYECQYSGFIKGQAGILAKDLKKKLEEEAEVPCPVCGTIHTRADEVSFAVWQEGTPTEEDVELAQTALKTARSHRETAQNNHFKKSSKLQQDKEALLQSSEKLLSISDWKHLSGKEGNTALSDAINLCKSNLAEAEKQYNKAVRDKEEKEKASAEKETIDKEIKSCEDSLNSARGSRQEAEIDTANAKTSVDNWKKQLEGFPETEKEALGKIKALDKEAIRLNLEIEQAKRAQKECEKAQAENQGKRNTAYDRKINQEKTKTKAQDTFLSQLGKWSFADQETYHKALSPEGRLLGQDGISTWILLQRETIDEYEQKRNVCRSRVELLTEKTKGKVYIDLSSIRDEIKDISTKLDKQKKTQQNLMANIRTDKKVYTQLQSIQELRKKYSKVSAKLKPMADTANGKLAFSRYVLSGFFERIIDQANEHLDKMTDGEYLLVRNDGGDKRSNLGLELKVLNTITNQERDTATLSGGQLFEASLSLALGLSRVVQMESASNVQIDSMFIDEGFGSLDGHKLDKSIEVLHQLSEGNRQIGIISHIARLDEVLPKKIRVIQGERGSSIRIETDE